MPTTRLTDKQVTAARAAPGQRLELWDERTPGLALRVTDRGKKTWIVRYRTNDGRQPRLKIGVFDEIGLAQARIDAGKVLQAVREGHDPAAARKQAKAQAKADRDAPPLQTMAQLVERYFTACEVGEWRPRGKQKRASTLAEERGLWRRYLVEPFGTLAIDDVTTDRIKQLLRGLVAKGRGVTSNRVRSLLSQVFNFAVSEDRLASSPVDKIARLGSETARDRVLSDEEIKTVWAAIKSPVGLKKPGPGEKPVSIYIGPSVGRALRLLLLTLTRRAEVAQMRVAEVNLAQSTWTIPGDRTKNGKALLVPLSPAAADLVREAIKAAADAGVDDDETEASAFVFPSPNDRGASIQPNALTHALRNLRLALDVPRFTPHDFRRTAATLMASERLGATPFIIGRILNHTTETGGASAVTLRHYAIHDYASEKRRVLNAWADLLLEITGERPRASNVTVLREMVA